jgi:hypothetical protein
VVNFIKISREAETDNHGPCAPEIDNQVSRVGLKRRNYDRVIQARVELALGPAQYEGRRISLWSEEGWMCLVSLHE